MGVDGCVRWSAGCINGGLCVDGKSVPSSAHAQVCESAPVCLSHTLQLLAPLRRQSLLMYLHGRIHGVQLRC